MKNITCASWCNDHKTEVDRVDATDVSEICRRAVTFGDVTVRIEDSPAWRDDPKWGGPIAVPDLIEVRPADARDFAAALIEAARLLEEANEESPAELQLGEGRDNYLGEQKS